LLNITGGSNLSLYEVNEAAEIVQEASDSEANIIFGAVIDEALKDEIRITVIATGFDVPEDTEGYLLKPNKTAEVKKEVKKDKVETENVELECGEETVPANEPGEFDIPTFLRKKR